MPPSPAPVSPRPLPERPRSQRALPPRPLPARTPATLAGHPAGRARPDPSGHRIAVAFGGLAAASALATAFLAPPPPASATDQVATLVDPAPVQHVTRYVQLQPGQTAPPNAAVAAAPQATPRVVVVTTRQSGTKK